MRHDFSPAYVVSPANVDVTIIVVFTSIPPRLPLTVRVSTQLSPTFLLAGATVGRNILNSSISGMPSATAFAGSNEYILPVNDEKPPDFMPLTLERSGVGMPGEAVTLAESQV